MRLIVLLVITIVILTVSLQPTIQAIHTLDEENTEATRPRPSSIPWITTSAGSSSPKYRGGFSRRNSGKNPYYGN